MPTQSPYQTIICKKSVYATPHDAELDIVRIATKNKNNKRKVPTHWYRCNDCHGIHLTSIVQPNQDLIIKLEKRITELLAQNHANDIEIRRLITGEDRHIKKSIKKDVIETEAQKKMVSLQAQVKNLRTQLRDLVTKMVQKTVKKEKQDATTK